MTNFIYFHMIFPLLDGHFRGSSEKCHDPSIWSQSCETAPTSYSSKLFSQQSSVDPNYIQLHSVEDPKLPSCRHNNIYIYTYTYIYIQQSSSHLDYVCNLSIETHGDLGSPMTSPSDSNIRTPNARSGPDPLFPPCARHWPPGRPSISRPERKNKRWDPWQIWGLGSGNRPKWLWNYPLVNVYILPWKDPPFFMGKSTINGHFPLLC